MKLMEQIKANPNNSQARTILYDNYSETYYFEYFFLRNITYY